MTGSNVDVQHRSDALLHGTPQRINFYCMEVVLIHSQPLLFSQKLKLAFFGGQQYNKKHCMKFFLFVLLCNYY